MPTPETGLLTLYRDGVPFTVTVTMKDGHARLALPKGFDKGNICYLDKNFNLVPISQNKVAEVRCH